MSQPIKDIPRTLLKTLQSTDLVCPLCSAHVPPRGVRPGPGPKGERWELVFVCPACGLMTAFDVERLSPRLLKTLHGAKWAAQLRRRHQLPAATERSHGREATAGHFLSAFVGTFVLWIVLTGSLNPIDLLWGVVAAFAVARFSYRLAAFNLLKWIAAPRHWPALLELLGELAWQLIRQNVTLSLRVLRPRLHIRPGIVAIPTDLRDDVALTLLGSLITLTPDTVVVDIDQERGLLYVHWIDVQTTAPDEVRSLIAAGFEKRVARLLK